MSNPSTLHTTTYVHTYPLANLIPSLLSNPAPPTHPAPGPSLPHPPAAGLEAGVQSHQEGVVGGLLKHMLLRLNPVNVLFVHHKVFLDHLHRIDAVGLLQLDLGREGRGGEGRGGDESTTHTTTNHLFVTHPLTTHSPELAKYTGSHCTVLFSHYSP